MKPTRNKTFGYLLLSLRTTVYHRNSTGSEQAGAVSAINDSTRIKHQNSE
jgi:hypothetical protein